ncbi:MAG: MCE family protein [Fibrobacter sp.]|nr:MCE family protein [Fibrobacter sp.]
MQVLKKIKHFRWNDFAGLLVGAAIATSAIILAATIFLTLQVKGVIGVDEYQLHCLFDKGLGLRVGTKVQVNGVEVGRVSNLELTKTGKVKLTFTIKKAYQPWITSDATVYATRDQNLIAERVINIDHPSQIPLNPQHILQDGQEIHAGQAQDIETVVEKAIEILDMAERVALNIDKMLLMALDSNTTLGLLLNSRLIYDKLLEQVDKLDLITTSTDDLLKDLKIKIPTLLDSTESAINTVAEVGEKLNTFSDGAIEILNSLDTTIYAVNLVLNDLQIITKSAGELLTDGEMKLERIDGLVSGLSNFRFIQKRIPQKDTIPIFSEEQW